MLVDISSTLYSTHSERAVKTLTLLNINRHIIKVNYMFTMKKNTQLFLTCSLNKILYTFWSFGVNNHKKNWVIKCTNSRLWPIYKHLILNIITSIVLLYKTYGMKKTYENYCFLITKSYEGKNQYWSFTIRMELNKNGQAQNSTNFNEEESKLINDRQRKQKNPFHIYHTFILSLFLFSFSFRVKGQMLAI